VKPVDQEQLDRALAKLERLSEPREDAGEILKRLEAALSTQQSRYPEWIASRIGDRILFFDLPRVTHFFAEDKLTFAVVKGKPHIVDHTISDLEQKLDPTKFCRIHRSTLLNLAWVAEMDSVLVRLRDEARTELVVARDRVRGLRERLEH
jgi:two-component system, LytTR family, response regulator